MVFLFLGMPVAFAIAISGAIFFILTPDIPWTILVQKSLSTTQSFTMLAIPLFIFAGNLMNNTGITSRLVKLANVLTGHMYGSIGQVSVVLSTLMGGVSVFTSRCEKQSLSRNAERVVTELKQTRNIEKDTD